ncbi:MAG: pitrilysin family protein [Bacteroidales bacterium]
MKMQENPGTERWTLSNGIRVIHRRVSSPVAHFGLFINTGSRDEKEDENGMAHFIEHVFFKGTHKRKAYHVLNRLESVGGDLNAFTTKEITCLYATFLNAYYDRTLELISDIAFHSIFPEKELEKEKEVIIDEINSYKDSPYELIFDDFEELVFDGHPLGRNVLGEPRNIRKFHQQDVLGFISRNYAPEQMVLCSVGNVPTPKLQRLLDRYYGSFSSHTTPPCRSQFTGYKPATASRKKETYQTHSMLGAEGYSRRSPKRMPLLLLSNLLGGPGLNSRLNLAVREKYGYCYHIESFYQHYSDTGIWGIYTGTTNGMAYRAIDLIKRELRKLRERKLGTLQLRKAKTQLSGQIAIQFESNLTKMMSMGKGILMDDRVDTVDAVRRKIDAITTGELIAAANEVFDEKQLSLLMFESR